MSAVDMTKKIKLSLLKYILSEFLQIIYSTLRLHFSLTVENKRQGHPVHSKSSHSPNPGSCFPLNLPWCTSHTSCCYTLLSPGTVPSV